MNFRPKGVGRSCVFLFLLLAALVGLRAVPALTIGSYEVKTIDILSDIFPSAQDSAAQSAASQMQHLSAAADSCPKGITCIEDYSDPQQGVGMDAFYASLAQAKEMDRPVRIAFFGDSFIEGDILTADLRDMLQQRFGGCGCGFVDAASPFTELRSTVGHSASGWADHSVLDKKDVAANNLGISQRYAVGSAQARITYRGVAGKARLDTFEVATAYFAPTTTASSLAVAVNGGESLLHPIDRTDSRLGTVAVEGRIGSLTLTVPSGRAVCYGVALEGRRGVVLDNFSLRGSSGAPLASVPMAHLQALGKVRPYDLVVLQYGLNVANKKQKDYSAYTKQMKPIVEHLRKAFPHAAILILSVGDRDNKVNAQLRTMPGIQELVAAQQTLAAEEGVAFWNLFEAMGGEGAISRMAKAQPAQAGKDFTHINRNGGRVVATRLYRALMHGFETYCKEEN